ncbi:MAG: S41 family peptidase [bacterium]
MTSIRILILICAALSLGFLRSAAADPPKVIKAVPDNGETGVDPSLREIRVEFDQDMITGGYSWVGGGEKYPKTRGRPRWVDARTCVLPVRLEPNHEYWLSINSVTYKNFLGANTEPAEPYPIWFKTAEGQGGDTTAEISDQDVEDSIQELRRAIDEDYSYRDLRNIDWPMLFAEFTPRLKNAKDPKDFAKEASKLLAYANDMHIWLTLEGAHFGTAKRDIIRNYNPRILLSKVLDWKEHNSRICTGRFEDGIGYILITNWSWDNIDELEPAYEALDEFAEAKGLIVDVRPNGGGDERLAQYFAGCFITEPRIYAKNVYRDPSDPSGFTNPPYDRVIEPKKGRPKYRGKVAVLMGQANMSSCEAFLLMMKQAPSCTLVGDRSFGSSGNPKAFPLANGVTVYLPSWKAMRPDGTVFEGEGIAPDVLIEATEEDFRQGDPVLDAALEFLRK